MAATVYERFRLGGGHRGGGESTGGVAGLRRTVVTVAEPGPVIPERGSSAVESFQRFPQFAPLARSGGRSGGVEGGKVG